MALTHRREGSLALTVILRKLWISRPLAEQADNQIPSECAIEFHNSAVSLQLSLTPSPFKSGIAVTNF